MNPGDEYMQDTYVERAPKVEPVWNTVAPELPTGYMYRVRRKAFGYVTIEVRKKRVFGSKQLSRVVLFPKDFPTTEHLIGDGCAMAANEAYEDECHVRPMLAEVDSYVGDHLSQEDK